MGRKSSEGALPCYTTHARRNLPTFLWEHGSKLSVALLLLFIIYGRCFPTHTCPPNHLCVPNEVSGSPSMTTPYIEYSEVTSTASVYRVSSLLKTVRSPYQLIQVRAAC